MTLTCVTYGRQIFGIGGRRAWADDGKAGCYDAPAFIYDAQSETTRSSFDVSTLPIPKPRQPINSWTARSIFIFSIFLDSQRYQGLTIPFTMG